MATQRSRFDVARTVAPKAVRSVESRGLDARVKIGGEQFHPDVGHFFRHDRVSISGDMDDLSVLQIVSEVADEFGLVVDSQHGHEFHDDNSVVLRIDWDLQPDVR